MWLNLTYYPGMCLKILRKTAKISGQESRSPGRDLNLGYPEYEGMLTSSSRRPVTMLSEQINIGRCQPVSLLPSRINAQV
jgi:hypothetical protein